MSNSIAPGSSADINVKVTALTTNPNVPVTYKTIILKKNLVNGVNTLTQEMMSVTNTKYVVKYDYVLGEDIIVPENCILEFDGGSIAADSIANRDTVTGTNTIINTIEKAFFKNVIIAGTWNNDTSYLSWFEDSDDYTNQIMYLSLLSKKIYLDKGGNIKGQILINKEVEIDGCNNVFNVYVNDTDITVNNYRTLYINCAKNVHIHNIKFKYKTVITSTSGKTYECLSIRNETYIGNQFTNIYNISVEDFDNRDSNPCEFHAIMLQNFDEGNSCSIHNIIIKNCINLGDGIPITGTGSIAGIRVQVSSVAKSTGVGEIYNVTVNLLSNCNPKNHNDLTIIEDCEAIYICAVPGVYGMKTKININLHDFHFTDVSERCFKLQGEGVSIRNVYTDFTTVMIDNVERPPVSQAQIINMQGANLYIENFSGKLYREIAQCGDGQFIIRNCVFDSPYTFEDGIFIESYNTIMENCIITKANRLRTVFYSSIDSTYTIRNSKIMLNNGSLHAHPSSVSSYIKTTINIENSYIEGLDNFVEFSNHDIASLVLKDSYFGTSTFGYMLQNFECINSKCTQLPVFINPKDNSKQLIKIINSEFIYNYEANGTLNIISNSEVYIENVSFINNASADDRKLTIKINNGVEKATLKNIKYNKIYNGKEYTTYEFSDGGGLVIFERKNTIGLYSFIIKNESNPTNPLNIIYDSNLNYDAVSNVTHTILPYIVMATRIINVSNLNFVGKDGVTYCYNNKNVYYRGGQWIDANGNTLT